MHILRSYLETGGKNATVRPYIWIIWLFVGPLVASIAIQYYIYVAVSTSILNACYTLLTLL